MAHTTLAPALVCLGMPLGTALVAYAYANAATDGESWLHFHLFWLGMLAFLVPVCLRLCNVATTRRERLALLIAVGAFNYLPKFLRTPGYPLFHDELAHWRQAELAYSAGHLFLPNPTVYISQYFPGLEAMTVTLRDLTGLSTFQLAAILIVCTHAAALLGIFVLAERLLHSAHAAGLAAFLYSLNPGFMFFETQYSYESIAFVYVIWVVVAAVNLQDATHHGSRRAAWFAVGVILAACCIVTHHLSSYVMLGILWLLTAVTWMRARRAPPASETSVAVGPIAGFTLLVTLGTAGWLVFVAPAVFAYLAEPIGAALQQLTSLLQHQQHGRTLFAKSTTPSYERWAAFASLALAAAGAGGGLLLLRRRLHAPAMETLVLFGSLFFASLPLMLTGAGNEGARRSWTFSYIGLCVLVAPAVVWLLRWASRHGNGARRRATAAVAILTSVVLIGNVTMHINELYRFPGPYVYGSDTRSTTAELLQTARWLRTTQGTGQSVVADRYTSQILSSFGLEWTPFASSQFPVWQLYFDPTAPSHELLRELRVSGYRYLVVDERMASYLPYLGAYFDGGEVRPGPDSRPPSRRLIDRFERLPWAIKIYQSDNLSIYRLNYEAMGVPWTLPAVATRARTIGLRG